MRMPSGIAAQPSFRPDRGEVASPCCFGADTLTRRKYDHDTDVAVPGGDRTAPLP
jgi:hypothetical protein